jgi:hypothetical protein
MRRSITFANASRDAHAESHLLICIARRVTQRPASRAISSPFREDPRKKRLIRACEQYRFHPRPVAHHNSFTDFVIARRLS